MKIDLTGKVAYITGGTRGIGFACATLLADCGCSLAISGTNETTVEKSVGALRERYSVDVIGLVCDVSDAAQVKGAFKKVHKHYGQLDIMINNAGVMQSNFLTMSTTASFDQIISVNVNGALYNLQMAAKLMARKQQGCIVNVGSIVGSQGAGGQIAYSGSKSAIVGMTKSAAKELASQNIRVNAIAPGFIETDLTKDFENEQRDQVIDSIAFKRAGSPEEVAKVVLFLVSDMSSYMTGQIIGVDGGMVI